MAGHKGVKIKPLKGLVAMDYGREYAWAKSKGGVKDSSPLRNGRYINASFQSERFVRQLDGHRENQLMDVVPPKTNLSGAPAHTQRQ